MSDNVKKIKEINVRVGGDTAPLNKALKGINAESRSLQGELKGVNSLLKFDPQNTELLSQKQAILSQAIAQTEDKLRILTQAQQKMSDAGKDISDEGYRDLQREIIATQQKLAGFITQLQKAGGQQAKTAQEAEKLGQKIHRIASHVPVVNKLADGFVYAKQKIADTVKESESVKKIGSAVENAKQKVDAFKEAHPAVKKVSDAFGNVKDKAVELAKHLPSAAGALKATGQAAGAAAVGILKVGAAATGVLAAGLSYTIKLADDTKGALNDFSAATGLTGESLKEFEGVMKEIYADNFGENMQDVADSMAVVQKNSRLIDPEETKKVTEYALALRDTFGYDIQEQMRAANMMMDQFGVTSEEAFSLIAQGAQDGWLDKNGDMLDSINEYSVHFKQLGINAEQMFNMLANGAYSGAFSVDKCGDAIKEFGIRVKDGSDGSKEVFEYLGHDADELFRIFNEGGADAAAMTQTLIAELAALPEGVEKTTAGVALFGTMWEDLGTEGISALSDMSGDFFDKTYDALGQINAIKYDTFGKAMQGVGRILQTSFIMPIGEKALPVFTEFAQELSKGATDAQGDIEELAEVAGEATTGLLDGLGDILPQLAQLATGITTGLLSSLISNLPMIATVGVGIIQQLLAGITGDIPTLTTSITAIIPILLTALMTLFPELVTAGTQILVNLIQGATQTIPTLINTITSLFPVIIQTIMGNLPSLITAGLDLLLALALGISQGIPQLLSMLPMIIDSVAVTMNATFPKIIETGMQILTALISGIVQAIPQLTASLPQIIRSTIDVLTQNLPQIIQMGIALIGALIAGIIQAIPQLIAALPQVITAIMDTFRAVDWGELGKNIIDGITTGVKSAASTLIEVFKDLAKQALAAVKDFFGIKSPSTVMRDQVGKMLPAGMAEGVELGMDEEERRIRAAMGRAVPTTIDGYIRTSGSRAGKETGATAANGGIVQNLTINSPRELSPYETARLNKIALQQTVLKIKRV